MFNSLDVNLFENLKKKKYFELEDFFDKKELKGVWFYIFKGKKGIGKSYCLNKLYWDIFNSKKDNILYIRTRREDLLNFKNTNLLNLEFPFEFEGNKIYTRKELCRAKKKKSRACGMLAYANNLSSMRSMNYANFKYIIYDEFVENNKSNYRNRDVFATNFMKFVMDVYRQTPDLKVFLMGNNDLSYDPFTDYFNIDVQNSVFNIDKENGLFFANLGEYYTGMLKDKQSYGLAYYDERLMAFLESNQNWEDLSLYENYSKKADGFIMYYIFYDEHLYSFIFNPKEDKFYVDLESSSIKGLPIYVLNDKDYMLCYDGTLLGDVQKWGEVSKLKNLVKSRQLRFLNDFAKDEIIEMIDREFVSIY